jgi:hypothetical protein
MIIPNFILMLIGLLLKADTAIGSVTIKLTEEILNKPF